MMTFNVMEMSLGNNLNRSPLMSSLFSSDTFSVVQAQCLHVGWNHMEVYVFDSMN